MPAPTKHTRLDSRTTPERGPEPPTPNVPIRHDEAVDEPLDPKNA